MGGNHKCPVCQATFTRSQHVTSIQYHGSPPGPRPIPDSADTSPLTDTGGRLSLHLDANISSGPLHFIWQVHPTMAQLFNSHRCAWNNLPPRRISVYALEEKDISSSKIPHIHNCGATSVACLICDECSSAYLDHYLRTVHEWLQHRANSHDPVATLFFQTSPEPIPGPLPTVEQQDYARTRSPVSRGGFLYSLKQHAETTIPPINDFTFYRTHLERILNISPTNELDLTDYVGRGPLIAAGGFGRVYQGKWKNVDHLPEGDRALLPAVVAKVVDFPVFEDERQQARRLKKLKRELEVWRALSHENILPLLGIAHIDGYSNMPSFVSPWMQNGSVIDFLNRNPSFPVVQFLYHIIKGLHYLHIFDPEIVHGDLKAANILVNHRQEACLCDFGLSRFAIENTLWKTDATQANGSLRWMAPELLQADETVPTRSSDVYAYGMTCYVILSGKIPFESVRNDCAVIAKVIKGVRPDRIDRDDLWALVTRCWAQDPHDRPPTDLVLLIMQDIIPST